MKLHYISVQLKEFRKKLSQLKRNSSPAIHVNEDPNYIDEHIVVTEIEQTGKEQKNKQTRGRLVTSSNKNEVKTKSTMEETNHKDYEN